MDFPMLFQASSRINNAGDAADDLIAAAQRGDDAAFGLIFEQHARFVYKFIRAMLVEGNAAEELTQETFLAAYKSIGGLRGAAGVRTWLCAIAKNVVYKHLRSHRRETAGTIDETVESLAPADDKNPLPDERFLSRELNGLIRAALAELDDDKRLVFTLKELQHLSYREISEITGCTIPKLKTDLHRAKIEMRRALRPYLEANQ